MRFMLVAFAFCRKLKTVRVSSGDAERVKKMLEDSGLDMSKIAVVEEDDGEWISMDDLIGMEIGEETHEQ